MQYITNMQPFARFLEDSDRLPGLWRLKKRRTYNGKGSKTGNYRPVQDS